MKTTNYLFLAAILISSISCSSAANTVQVNVNAAQETSLNAATPEPAAVASEAKKTAPDALVKSLYEAHKKNNSPFFQTKNRELVNKYFDKNLADLIWKDAVDSKGEVGAIDGDPLYNAQDTDIKNFVIGQAKTDGEKAEVPVNFENFGEKQSFVFMLVSQKGEWKISDINYGGGSTLLGFFKDNAQKASVENGEFEGKYQVGETSCTVKPIKMAFEVKWAKGSGSEIFFSEERANDKYIFAGNPETGKANVFSFDDASYNTGTFYRADGKEFTIKRIK